MHNKMSVVKVLRPLCVKNDLISFALLLPRFLNPQYIGFYSSAMLYYTLSSPFLYLMFFVLKAVNDDSL